ncbi:uncharacterized protein F4807DRAFT_462006 [Annulohypoxylon truncatum]|uniref:uncharacterized protein n=1 Tax=Annulohypoxylon truncatum TaxID=327061 RepID=UPI00200779DD|nr:uncharacterized protein F4807DRAFT_462006 [Annulohypoxylon truncatum]KAI1208285.1 hypothetical protein F4807DRAFT_462006 [Annulohypoxylon truncatum]
MASSPRQPSRLSRTPLQGLEDEIKVGVFDQGNVPYNGDPQLIVPNGRSGCYGLYLITPEGVEFIFHHATMKFATTCGCLTKMNPGETTFQLSAALDDYRLRLIRQKQYRIGPKLAAMIVMKLFLGLEIPEPFHARRQTEIKEPDLDAESHNTKVHPPAHDKSE